MLRARGPAGRPARTSSRRSGWPRRWPRCAAGRCAGLAEVTEATPGGAVRRRRRCALELIARGWWSASGSARCRTTCRRCRWPRDLAAQQRAAAAQAGGARARPRPRPAQATSTWRAAGCCTGCGCSACRGASRSRRRRGTGHVPGDVAAALAAGVRGRPGRGAARGAPPCATRPPRKVADAARQAATLGRASPRWSSGACSPTCPRRCRRCCAALDDRAALDADVAHLMAALPALARTLRYGDVRGTDVGRAAPRSPTAWSPGSASGLPAAVGGARRRRGRGSCATASTRVHAAVALLDDAELRERWLDDAGAGWPTARRPARPAGRAAHPAAARRRPARRRRGRGAGCALRADRRARRRRTAAAWVEGFLAGGGLLLVHDDALLRAARRLAGRHRRRTRSSTCCRCCAARSAPSPRRERRAIGERVRGRPRPARPAAGEPRRRRRRAGRRWCCPTLSAAARPRTIDG